MENIKCKVCSEIKKTDFFYRDKESKNGYRSKCKSCTKDGKTIRIKTTTETYNTKLKLKQGNNYELVSEYNNKSVEILHLKCGKIRNSTPQNALIRGCPYCKSNTSYISRIFHSFLKYNEVEFKCEYKTDACKNIKPLPFDFAIMKKDILQGLVEIDGEQHFKGNGRFDLKEIRFRDNIKTQYCIENNIDLNRVPYDSKNIINDFEKIILKYGFEIKTGFIIEDDYYSQIEATHIRNLYLDGHSILDINNILNKNTKYISRVINYVEFPKQDIDIKDKVLEKYKKHTAIFNRRFDDLSNEELEDLKNLIIKGVSSVVVCNHLNINRKNKKFLKIYSDLKKDFKNRTNYEILQYKEDVLMNVYSNTKELKDINPDFSTNTIISCCNGHKKTYKGFKWYYRDKVTCVERSTLRNADIIS